MFNKVINEFVKNRKIIKIKNIVPCKKLMHCAGIDPGTTSVIIECAAHSTMELSLS